MTTDKNTLKSWFLRGLKPLATQFAAWIDSYWHKDETIPIANIEDLPQTLNSKANSSDLDAEISTRTANETILQENIATVDGDLTTEIQSRQDAIAALEANKADKTELAAVKMGLTPHAPCKMMLSQNENGEHLNYTVTGEGVGKKMISTSNGAFASQELYFVVGDRILFTAFGYERVNAGIYVLTVLGDENTPWELTRAVDFDGSETLETMPSSMVPVNDGLYANYIFYVAQKGTGDNGSLIIDTDIVNWAVLYSPIDQRAKYALKEYFDALYSAKSSINKTVTIAVEDWSTEANVRGFFEATITDADVSVSSFIDGCFDNAFADIVITARILPQEIAGNGSFKLETVNIPSDSVDLIYKILR